jgi:four helix bundle protein
MGGVPDIEDRAMEYAVRAVQFFRHLKKKRDDVASIIGRQFLRSATSIGANLVEARGGESKRDFVHKCAIAQKEARESLYWLQLAARIELVALDRLTPLIRETEEILAVITSIIRNVKVRLARRPPPDE